MSVQERLLRGGGIQEHFTDKKKWTLKEEQGNSTCKGPEVVYSRDKSLVYSRDKKKSPAHACNIVSHDIQRYFCNYERGPGARAEPEEPEVTVALCFHHSQERDS